MAILKSSKVKFAVSIAVACYVPRLSWVWAKIATVFLELPECKPGQDLASVLGLSDVIIDIAITPNRGDCFSVYGVARDLAAAGLGVLKSLQVNKTDVAAENFVRIETSLCSVFAALKIENVENITAPEWMQHRLKAAGKTPRGLLIDVTNYSTFAYGRPLHSFDADKVQGTLIIKEASGGESFAGLDDIEYTLPGGAIIICDDSGIVSLAGIMGGKSTAVSETTRRIILESAVFDTASIALTAQKLNIHTDARQRFERGIDASFTIDGLFLAAQHAGGQATGYQLAGQLPDAPALIDYNYTDLEKISGLSLPETEVLGILTKLGFEKKHGKLSVPPWRHDMSGAHSAGAADWVEEVLRIIGYQEIPATKLPERPFINASKNPTDQARFLLKQQGFQEALSYTFYSPEQAELFGGDIELANPISRDLSLMRQSLLANLLQAVKANQTERGQLYETGAVYFADSQQEHFSGVEWGNQQPVHWQSTAQLVDTFTAKAAALNILQQFSLEESALQTSVDDLSSWYHPGQSGRLMLGAKNCVAQFGMLHPAYQQQLDLPDTPIALFEVYLDSLPQRQQKPKPFVENSLQAVERDLAFIIDADLQAEQLLRLARGSDKKHITDVLLFDVYQGKGVPDAKKSLAIRLKLQPQQQTFTEEEINKITSNVTTQVEKKLGATLRS